MTKIRWGILSTANIAQKALIPAIGRAENAEVVAIGSGNPNVKEVAEKFNIPTVYNSYDALLDDPNLDAVYIPLPNHLHKEWVMKAAQKGKHVLSEKPAALNAEETKELVEACKKHGMKYMEAFMYQFHGQHKRVKEIIASGEIGDVQLMKSSFSFFMANPEGNIRMDPKMGGGSIYDIGCYCIHSIRHILDDEPEEIYVEADMHPEYNIDNSAYGIFKMKSGVRAMFDCSFTMPFRTAYEVIGSEGVIKVPRAFRPDKNDHEGLIVIEKEDNVREEIVVTDQYKTQVEHLSNAILENKDPIYSGEDTIKNMKIIDACYESIKQNTK
ncbi:putative dehydrogenase [Salirhabdus euzebyi]|uniref:Putative dehydrogenase n=1 Tax=Salirhabdus euzebyi TaxID=394506 RepID=A0A841Q9I7_9BACI|nr:Gfo/Idh/MocA family oxidoreductase [Salirhabdus euzebyi]MBB6455070.1 putative dehydrogenase [Salirhabdus euzebyi]